MDRYTSALIVGAGSGLSASLARAFAKAGMQRRAGRALDRQARRARAGDRRQGLHLRRRQARRGREAVRRSRRRAGDARRRGLQRQLPHARAVRRPRSGRGREGDRGHRPSAASWWRRRRRAACCRTAHGAILFTGASASVKGYAQSAPFAMGKFALRGLAQSMARELSPQGIHVAHFVIDGGIRSARRAEPADKPGLAARSRRHRRELSARAAAAAQRLDAGGRAAAVGGEILTPRPIALPKFQPPRARRSGRTRTRAAPRPRSARSHRNAR